MIHPTDDAGATAVLSPYRDRLTQRLIRCTCGLALFGVGINMFVAGNLGLAPWDVFHQGVSEMIDVPLGLVLEATSLVVLLLWIPLHIRPGLGTILNALEIGLVVYFTDGLLPTTDALAARLAYVIGAVLVIAVGSAMYIGAGLGSGPRDGLMLGLAQRGISVRVARTVIEVTVLVFGLLLGGTIGVGTLAFTFGIGPVVQPLLPRFAVRQR
jgi:uncharacterized membrane protein YczE